MKVKRYDNVRLYLFLRQDGGKAIELGLVSLIDATKQAQKLAKRFMNDHVGKQETEVTVQTASAVLTTVYAQRTGRKVNIFNY